MGFKKVVVVGGGVLGSQIAFQTAYWGFEVYILLRSQESIERAKQKIEWVRKEILKSMEKMKTDKNVYCKGLTDSTDLTVEEIDGLKARVEKAYKELKLTTNYEEACKNADLIIESIAEDIKQKKEIYQKLQPYLEEKTVIVTNSSTYVPSQFADSTGRPEKYLAFHFINIIWIKNLVEIMGHAGTDKKYFDEMVKFAEEIRMIPLKVLKEHPKYILNSMLSPFLRNALTLWANDVADVETIDKTWKLCTDSKRGPFEILDITGIATPYYVLINEPSYKDPNSDIRKIADKLKIMLDAGKKGNLAGEGFYKNGKMNA